jgi:hypothetical protein
MKKISVLLFGAVAVLAVISCEKKDIETPVSGTPIEISVGFDEIDGAQPGSKMSNNDSDVSFKWDPGDALQIFSYNWDNDILTDWGMFTTENGGVWGKFRGVIPAGYTAATHGDKFTVVFQQGKSFSLTRSTTSGRYDLKFNIPANQDGTGVKYCLFGSATTTWPTFDGDKSFSGMMLRCYTGLSVINVSGPDIRTIKITLDHAKNHGYCLASSGDKLDINYNCSNNGLSGGGSKTITINNNDEVLSGNIYFASRQTNGNANNGYPILTFEFINSEGKTATRVLKLAKGANEDGTASTYAGISTYNKMNRFPAVSLTAADFI